MGPWETRGLSTWVKNRWWRMGQGHTLREFALSVSDPLFLKLHISLPLFLLSLYTHLCYLLNDFHVDSLLYFTKFVFISK